MFFNIVIPIKYCNLLYFIVIKNSQTLLPVLCLILENIQCKWKARDVTSILTEERMEVESTATYPKSHNS